MPNRAQIVAKAREYLGTPFKNQHRMKGKHGGVDCVGLVLLVAEELHISDKDSTALHSTDHLNYTVGASTDILPDCRARLIEKPVMKLQPGDVVVIRFMGSNHHSGIISSMHGSLGIIHAYNIDQKCVIEHILDAKWRRRIAGAFEYPGTTD